MAKYRKINPRIWNDETFRELTAEGKLMAFYLITGQSNRIGLFNFSLGKAAEELGSEAELIDVQKAIDRVCDSLSWAYDKGYRVIYIPTWWKYNPPVSIKHIIGCLTDIEDIPQTPLVQEFMANRQWLTDKQAAELDRLSDRLSIGYAISGAGAGAGAETEAGAHISPAPEPPEDKVYPRPQDIPLEELLPLSPTGDLCEVMEAWAESLGTDITRINGRDRKQWVKHLNANGKQWCFDAIANRGTVAFAGVVCVNHTNATTVKLTATQKHHADNLARLEAEG